MRAGDPILDHVDGVVLCLEARTLRPTYASAATRDLVGEPIEAWRARPGCWRRLFDPEDWPRVARLCRAVARDGRQRRMSHLVRVGSARPRTYRTSVSLLPDKSGDGRLLAHMLDLGEDGAHGDLGAHESWIREILRQAPMAVFLLDRKGVVRLAEGRGLGSIGIDPVAALGRSMLHGRWPCHWLTENAARALRGDAFSEVVTVHGGWVSIKYVPLRDRNGRVQGAMGLASDIAECKRVVDLIGTIDAVLWQVQGHDRKLTFIGGAAAKLLGEDPETWLGRTDFFESHLCSDERRTVVDAIEAVAADGIERTVAHRFRRADGHERWCRTTLRAIPGEASAPADVVGLMLDVSERKAVEKALQPRDRRWQILAEQAPVIVYTVDRDLCFTGGIGAGMAALGSEASTLLGAPIEHYFQAASARPLIDAHRRALTGATVRTRSRWRRRTYDLRLEPLRDGEGSIVGVVGVAVDVTQESRRELQRERMLEAERAAHAQADEAVHVRDQLFGIASHELRTPLAGLLLTIQSARMNAASDQVVQKLQLAERMTLRLNHMIEQLLDATRLSAGRQLELEVEELDLGLLTQQVVARFEPEIDAAKSPVNVQALGPVVGRWDRSRLDQVITNLISNAIKYGRGQPVEIAIDCVRPDLARLSVRDHGIGIASTDMGLLFRPFRRLHRNHNYHGFGLGLFIVSEIVRAHGGEIRVESEPDKGAQFTVELPTIGT